MKFSQETQAKLDKLPPKDKEKVLNLVASRLAIDEMKRRMYEQNRTKAGK